MELHNANENMLHDYGNLLIWLWKKFGNAIDAFCTNTAPYNQGSTTFYLQYSSIPLSILISLRSVSHAVTVQPVYYFCLLALPLVLPIYRHIFDLSSLIQALQSVYTLTRFCSFGISFEICLGFLACSSHSVSFHQLYKSQLLKIHQLMIRQVASKHS